MTVDAPSGADADRRACGRVTDDLGIAVSVIVGSSTTVYQPFPAFLLTADISQGGLRFFHDQPMPRGTALRIRVALTKPLTTLMHEAQVCWSRPAFGGSRHETGVSVSGVTDRDRDVWTRYVQRKLASSTDAA